MNFKEICEVNESSISAYDMITCIRNALQQKDPKIFSREIYRMAQLAVQSV